MSDGQLLPSTLVRGIEQLEPMPVTAQRLVALMQGEDVSLARIAELVEFDQAIAASVLRHGAIVGVMPALVRPRPSVTRSFVSARCPFSISCSAST